MIDAKILLSFASKWLRRRTFMTLLLTVLANLAIYNIWNIAEISQTVYWMKLITHLLLSLSVWYMVTYYIQKPWLMLAYGAKWNIYQIGEPDPHCSYCGLPLIPTASGTNVYVCPSDKSHEYCFRDSDGRPADMRMLRNSVKELLKKHS